jgi:nucleoside-diphosphate-sugar epimerase
MLKNFKDPLVLVVGGAGYIGCPLVSKLLDAGYPVRVLDNFLFGNHGIKSIQHEALQVIEGDIRDISIVSHAVKGADIVIMLAAIVGRRTEDTPRKSFRDINLLASSVVLEAAKEQGASRFIFASTDSVYGTQSGMLYETAVPEPVSFYSRLKLRMEEKVISSKRRSFHPTALRIATSYGYSPRMRFDLVLNSLVRDAVCKNEITIESGDQCRAIVHVDDVASGIMATVKAHENLISGEVFNLGSDDPAVTIIHLANLVKQAVPETTISILEGEADLVNYHLSCSKIKKILDYKPTKKIEDSIIEIRDRIKAGEFKDPFSIKYNNT